MSDPFVVTVDLPLPVDVYLALMHGLLKRYPLSVGVDPPPDDPRRGKTMCVELRGGVDDDEDDNPAWYDEQPVGGPDLLTEAEHRFLKISAMCAEMLADVIGRTEPQFANDWAEAAVHIHGIQNMVLRNAAARAYPAHYRQLGRTMHP